MSTEEREKAARDYVDHRANRIPPGLRRAVFADFVAGWDARGQVTRDREAIARVMAMVDGYDGCFDRVDVWNALEQRERDAHPDAEPFSDREDCEFWLRRADAILALFNEKGNE